MCAEAVIPLPHLGKGIGNAGNGRDSRSGVQHQHDAEAVDEYRCRQRQLSPEDLFSAVFISTNICFLSAVESAPDAAVIRPRPARQI